MSFLNIFKQREQIRPELITAFNSKIPDTVNVVINSSADGGYVAEIQDIDYCVTQANSGKEIIEMVNDAMHTSLNIPEEYRKYVTHFQPSEELVKQFGMKVPEEYLNKNFLMKQVTA